MKIDLTEEEMDLIETGFTRHLKVINGLKLGGSDGEKMQNELDSALRIMRNIVEKIGKARAN